MARTRKLRRGQEVTYSWAKTREQNLLIALQNHEQTVNQFNGFLDHAALIQQTVAHHMGISPNECKLDIAKNWMFGSYNVCIPVIINGCKQVLIRFPISHRVGESFRPGNADEKIRCEAGTYAWLNENCPSVPVPRLYGFALSTGQTVRHEFLLRCMTMSVANGDSSLPPLRSSHCFHDFFTISDVIYSSYLAVQPPLDTCDIKDRVLTI